MKRVLLLFYFFGCFYYSFSDNIELCLSGSGTDENAYSYLTNPAIYELSNGNRLFSVISNSNDGIFPIGLAIPGFYNYFIFADSNNSIQKIVTDSLVKSAGNNDGTVAYTIYLLRNQVVLFRTVADSNAAQKPILFCSYALLDLNGNVLKPFTLLDTIPGSRSASAKAILTENGFAFFIINSYVDPVSENAIQHLYRIYNISNDFTVTVKDIEPVHPQIEGSSYISSYTTDTLLYMLRNTSYVPGDSVATPLLQVYNAAGNLLLDTVLNTIRDNSEPYNNGSVVLNANDKGEVWVYLQHINDELGIEQEKIVSVNIYTGYSKELYNKTNTMLGDYRTVYPGQGFQPYLFLLSGTNGDDSVSLYKLSVDSLVKIHQFSFTSYYLSISNIWETRDSGLLMSFMGWADGEYPFTYRLDHNKELVSDYIPRLGYIGYSTPKLTYFKEADQLMVFVGWYDGNDDGGDVYLVDYSHHISSPIQNNFAVFGNLIDAYSSGENLFVLLQHPDSCFSGSPDIFVYRLHERYTNDLEIRAFLDDNNNNQFDAGEAPYSGVVNDNFYMNDGVVHLLLDTTRTNIKFYSNSSYFTSSPDSIIVKFDQPWDSDTIWFAVHPLGQVFDAAIHLGNTFITRPGFKGTYVATCSNFGNQQVDTAFVKIIIDPRLHIDSISREYTISGDTLLFNLYNMPSVSKVLIFINFTADVSPVLNIADTMNSYAFIYTTHTDVNPDNNYYWMSDIARGSYDPNDKNVDRDKIYLTTGTYQPLTYTIRFENTGTDTAFNIIIRDTLPGKLDINTLRILASSHPFSYVQANDKELIFTFSNIQLPPKSVNEEASHGFISYQISPVTSLLENDEIKNKAFIKFDFNIPIETGTAVSKVFIITAVHQTLSFENDILVYPNPAQDQLIIALQKLNGENVQLKLFDISGKILQMQIISQQQTILDISGLPAGEYVLQVETITGNISKKIIVAKK